MTWLCVEDVRKRVLDSDLDMEIKGIMLGGLSRISDLLDIASNQLTEIKEDLEAIADGKEVIKEQEPMATWYCLPVVILDTLPGATIEGSVSNE